MDQTAGIDKSELWDGIEGWSCVRANRIEPFLGI